MIQADELLCLQLFVADHRERCGWWEGTDHADEVISMDEERFETFREVTLRCTGCGEAIRGRFGPGDERRAAAAWQDFAKLVATIKAAKKGEGPV